ncbi:PQQ-binding-like beta-propeller repeat protein [Opitutia bacterium ISCC 51]|nr:PQQ-binding-like beta-propeller repeat protein [Opitutae bacterium ISCC 51]QXD27511.1 PQQ-binding-like beta-propeller repeat protein [Opitutae bacterium ISCC 52]
MLQKSFLIPSAILGLTIVLITTACTKEEKNADWPVYLGDSASSQSSEVNQITPKNVDQLEIAWTFDAQGVEPDGFTNMQCNPLVINGTVYLTSATFNLYALDGKTGEPIWKINPFEEISKSLPSPIESTGGTRGMAYWSGPEGDRILLGIANYLLAINPDDGTFIEGFGNQGHIDLKKGLGRNIDQLRYITRSPGIIYQDLIIMGSSVSESLPAAPGHIRAFNVKTGEQVWRFNTIPQPGEYGYETWPKEAYKEFGGANTWAGMAVDEKRGLVYCPTGSATFDYYGGDRLGDNLFANSLICLNAKTGERVWHYQTVHHDLFDYDLPIPPNLLTVNQNGKEIPAVAQLTKQGYVFLFNRVTGEPLFEIEEIPVPASTMPGEIASKTQPRPTKPAPFVREVLSPDQLNDVTPETKAEILAKYSTMDPHVPWTPGSLHKDTIVHPGMIGGAEWGGAAADENGILYFNSNESSAILTMIDATSSGSPGEALYKQNCIVCHGEDLSGGTAFGQVVPTLIGIEDRMDRGAIAQVIQFGGTTMPGFRHFSGKDVFDVISFIASPGQTGQHAEDANDTPQPNNVKYIHTGNNIWTETNGYPAIKPPWGNLNALDLNTGEYLWQIPFGEYPELIEKGIPATGRVSYGGPIVTASGVMFIAASLDNHMRAYDMKTGDELWRTKLPFGGYATPSTYMIDGKQYVLIACGGGRGSPTGDQFVAFALPH